MKNKKPALISKETVVKSFGIRPFLASIVMSAMRINKLNRFYRSLLPVDSPVDLFQKALKKRNITVDVDPKFLDQLPDKPFLTISNHAFGFLDGMILISLVGQKHPGFKVTANYLVAQLDAIGELFIAVNPFDSKGHKGSGGTKLVMEELENGNPIGLFPAGEVATRYKGSREITDRPWMLSVFRLIKLAQVPVIPFYYRGTNSRMFHILGRIHPLIRTFRLIKEFFKKKNTIIRMETGQIIQPEEYNKYDTPGELREFFRSTVFKLK
jgi:putative hemolysin